jgi:hypothetical protein
VVNTPDVVNLLVAEAHFDNASANAGKTVTATGLSLSGADAGNYQLSSTTATTTATIWALPTGTALVSTAIPCNGATGTVSITPGPLAVGPFVFYLGTSNNTTGIFSGLTAGTYSWSMTDANGCNSIAGSVVVGQPSPNVVSGNIKYFSSPTPLPMSGVSVKLVDQSTLAEIGPVASNASGDYSFPNVCTGNYNIICSYSAPIGNDPVNVTDAALVSQWGLKANLGIAPAIEKVVFYAGDVILNNNLNGNDASTIQDYFLFNGTHPWPVRPAYTFWLAGDMISGSNPVESFDLKVPSVSVTVPTAVTGKDIYCLFTGDFNRSGVPPGGTKSANSTLTLNYGQTHRVNANSEVELPVFAATPMEVGAISLIMNFPQDKVEVLGVNLTGDAGTPVLFNVSGNELRIAWTSLTPLSLKAGDKMLTLNVKLIGSLGQDETIRFNLADNPLNELADGSSSVITNAAIMMETMAAATNAINEISAEKLQLYNYPNPFTETTTFAYTLPFNGEATLEIFNMLGSKVNVLLNESKTAGDYKLTVNSNSLKPGVYTAVLKLKTDGQILNRTIKIVRNQ